MNIVKTQTITERIISVFPKTKTEYLKKYDDNFDKDCHILYEYLSGNLGKTVPSDEVDEIWHWMILYTQHYSNFCIEEFGKFIHHIPSDYLCSAPSENGKCTDNSCDVTRCDFTR